MRACLCRHHLQQVLRALHDGEINAGLQNFFDCGVRIWIGDALNGRAAEASLARSGGAWSDDNSLAHWLHEPALRLYPDSDYARRHRA
jgi:hypothetical protein